MEANNQAMREALCDIVMLTMKVGYSIHGDVACGIIASKAKHALAKPPRNCDVGTAEEQSRRLSKFCRSHGGVDGVPRCEKCRFLGDDNCGLMWAQMVYQEKE